MSITQAKQIIELWLAGKREYDYLTWLACRLSRANCAELDGLVFCCEQCGWWFEQSEMSDKSDAWICTECGDE